METLDLTLIVMAMAVIMVGGILYIRSFKEYVPRKPVLRQPGQSGQSGQLRQSVAALAPVSDPISSYFPTVSDVVPNDNTLLKPQKGALPFQNPYPGML